MATKGQRFQLLRGFEKGHRNTGLRSFRELGRELVELVRPMAEELDSVHELEGVVRIMDEGTGADRQIRVFEETHDLKAVVDSILEESVLGVG